LDSSNVNIILEIMNEEKFFRHIISEIWTYRWYASTYNHYYQILWNFSDLQNNNTEYIINHWGFWYLVFPPGKQRQFVQNQKSLASRTATSPIFKVRQRGTQNFINQDKKTIGESLHPTNHDFPNVIIIKHEVCVCKVC
jgi:hypothetical protein